MASVRGHRHEARWREVAHPQAVRKVYRVGQGGAETEYWEVAWEAESRDPDEVLLRLLAAQIPMNALVLEAGCGRGEVVQALDTMGRPAVGVDLARRALQRVKQDRPDARLAVGDVTSLPFADATFDAIASLGVVEHFEAGPGPVLREHLRVLRPGGILFLTVPLRSWYRRWTDVRRLGSGTHRSYEQRGRQITVAGRPSIAATGPGVGAFHQYEFSPSTIVAECTAAGYEVVEWRPFGVIHALGDSPLVSRLTRRLGPPAAPSTATEGANGSVPGASVRDGDPGLRSQVRRAVVDEDGEGVFAPLTWGLTRLMGHMQAVLARRPATDEAPRRCGT